MNKKKIYLRADGRYEGRYKKGVNAAGRAVYGSVYGHSEDEVAAALDEIEQRICSSRRVNELNLLILGAGMHGHDILEIAESLKVFSKISFLDDSAEGERIIGKCKDADKFLDEYACAFVAIGDNKIRKKLALSLEEKGFRMPSIIAPGANVSPAAVLGKGLAILAGSTVSESEIGDYSIVESNALVGRDAKLGSFSRLDCGAMVPKGKDAPEGTWLKPGEIFKKR